METKSDIRGIIWAKVASSVAKVFSADNRLHMSYWPSVQSRWLDIGRVLFFFAFSWTETKLRAIKTQKGNEANIHWAILTKQAWSITYLLFNKILRFNENQEWNVYFESQEENKLSF